MHREIGRFGVAAAACLASSASAQVYPWATWVSTGPQGASATDTFGTVFLQTSANPGVGVVATWPVRFDGVPFTPVNAPSAAVQNLTFNDWSFVLDFSSVSNTTGLILGVGNFGHGSAAYPGYRLEMFDTSSAPMSLGLLGIIGSYDHTWTDTGDMFNDDVSLNTATGDFVPTPVPGLNENNTDILLLSLPAGVGSMQISTVSESAGDTLNVVVAAPAPGAVALLGLGGLVCARRRR